ncbi:MAG: YbdK family carboxylate-amine ligase [Gammaproteobacteria bacterium]|nr:MAG: YbdK family carboxylate-amine ligase [Gammaproteobacteria bacterium]
MSIEFHPSDGFTVGMEMEFQLIDEKTLDLVDGIMPLMEFYPGSINIKPEFIQNTVEVASRPCRDIAELGSHMRSLISELLDRCGELDMQLCGAGTHPFCKRMAAITPQARYQAMERLAGLLSHSQITFATHVHLGMPSGDEAVRLMHELKAYLPLLVALSANSPFWYDNDTGFAAYRHRILAASRSYDLPPDFTDWSGFQLFFNTMQHARVIEGINDIHWYIRPRPHLGTLEIQIMDAQATISEALALAAFIRALAVYLQNTRDGQQGERPLQSISWWSLKDNCFIASRFGIDAQFIINEKGDLAKLKDIAFSTLEAISPHADPVTERPHLDHLRERIDSGLPYELQRAVFRNTGAFEEVVQSLAEVLKREKTEMPACAGGN